ncbi:HlyD family type I secretion periplasmic adaptor subunit [Piscinibacter sp. Jin2]|uniref:Membrane fusion protein (MFP) family protein n=1 Tax=Aquariibacter lacus TaxID=2801332 RepID=A0A9X0XG45_9BURK|nr:HlyD family type I secretion periplasmic adaptor subunit [Piscinibacter lacus]MBL0720277.1 HlyD family type I secretion periplasmic adaptor subunit [Piscinibacter lacus]
MPTPDKNALIPIEAEDAIQAPGDTGRIARIGLLILGLGFGGFLAWAAYAPLDEGVPTHATVSIDTKRKPVQHPQGGRVREVRVREGQQVQEGELLMRLGDAVARAHHEASRQRYFSLRAAEGRLLAEQAGSERISFHPDLAPVAQEDPQIQQHLLTQQQLFASRRTALASAISAMQESIRGQEEQIRSLELMAGSRKTQMDLLARELQGVRNLVAEGYAPANRQMELERAQAELTVSSNELLASQAQARSTIQEFRQRIEAQRAEYRKEVQTQLAEVQREVQAEVERFKAVAEDLRYTDIKAPVSGQVVGLTVHSPGAVVGAGQKIMDIVPGDEALVLEAQVPQHVIDRIAPGKLVDVRFSAFAHAPQLVAEGRLDSLSRDILIDEVTRLPYYLARISLTEAGLKTLGRHQLQPGMGAEVLIKTGERSVLTYLLHPLTKRLAASLKEE